MKKLLAFIILVSAIAYLNPLSAFGVNDTLSTVPTLKRPKTPATALHNDRPLLAQLDLPDYTPMNELAYIPIASCAGDPNMIYQILLGLGVPRISAIQELGSWQTESGFNACQKNGDGGIAWGLNSWHPGRRYDMPQDLIAQVKWAITVEMPRDCHSCYEQFMSAQNVETARNAIQHSTRWGKLGNRWQNADHFATIFK